jgi:hypothetical protein
LYASKYENLMTVPVTKDDENYTTVMVSSACPEFIEGSNHESLSFDRLRMTRVDTQDDKGRNKQ